MINLNLKRKKNKKRKKKGREGNKTSIRLKYNIIFEIGHVR